MRITDELREWVSVAKPAVVDGCSISVGTMTYGCKKALLAIADRIDAEHDREMIEARTRGWLNGYDEGFASADDWLGQHEDAMAEHGWVRLPVDANGVPIRVGDVLTDGEYTFRVDELAAFGDGSWSIRNDDGNAWAACDVTHHHEPTVEDVLRECCYKYHSLLVDDMNDAINRVERDYIAPDEIIAEYASKLRLASDE